MATPPRPTSAEVDAALARIQARHEKVDDQHRASMGTEPRDVLAYLRRRAPTVSRAIEADDIWDELTLSAALRWEELERERALLRRARSVGLSLAEVGAYLGIRTRQGTQDYLDRLDALVRVGTPDVHLTRAARRQAKARPSDQRWIDDHHSDVREVVTELLRQVDRAITESALSGDDVTEDERNDTSEWLDELRADLADGALSPATMALLGLVLGDLRTDPRVQSFDRGHGLHRALRAAERLRARFSEAR